jgi:hypothetical protein
MFSRIRTALELALLLSLLTSITAFAKGSFSFITISGADLKDVVRVTDKALTIDYFAFAKFHLDRTDVPADPGIGYDITRYYTDGKREWAFDQLHYYPNTGFVFYDGIVGGESEYDGKWYKADPKIKPIFENTLSALVEPVSSSSQPQPDVQPIAQAPVNKPIHQAIPITPIIVIVAISLGIILVVTFWWRKSSTQ